MIGRVVSHYKIVEKLGEGGMGAVFKAEDTKLRRAVALKCLPLQLASDEKVKQRFLHEAQASSALNHPNIATIFYMFEEEGQEFICMEYVEGQTLTELIGSDPLPINRALEIAIQVADGLSEAHKKGIIHRDIKADNIMITPRGLIKIMDFGLAKLKGVSHLTRTGSTLGTIAYMSPEQAQGLEVDLRTDIFSLGVVFYEMLAAKRPFRGEHEAAILYSLLNEDPEPIEISPQTVVPAITTILQKSLEKDTAYRYQTMEEMLADLRAARKIFEGTPTPSTPGQDITPVMEGISLGTEMLDPEQLIGQTIGNYQVIEEIGRGGMGIVYKALQISLNREVALKVLPKQFTLDAEFLHRFRREARAAAGLNHPNIVQIYEIGQQSGINFFVMEYVEGVNLKNLIEQEAPFPLLKAIDIIWDTCNALDFAHTHGVIHRDIKPHNIMISKIGETKVFDFGIARAADSAGLTTTGTSIGTPQYMSPEQARGEKEMDGRADLYSLGIVFYEMIVGMVPFEGSTAVGTMYRHVNEIPDPPSKVNPDVPEELNRIVMKTLQKEKEKRYQTGAEMIDDLRLVKENLPADRDESAKRTSPRRKKKRGIFTLVAAAFLLVFAAAVVYYYFGFMSRYDFVLRTEPPGAIVSEEGRIIGATPLKMTADKVGFGDHIFVLSLPGYAEEIFTFSLDQGEKMDQSFVLTQSICGLTIQSEPPGARVHLDLIERGSTPLDFNQLKSGSHLITLNLAGYVPRQDTVVVEEGRTETLNLVLSPLPSTLIVSSLPESAHVFIDSMVFEEPTPLEIQLDRGEHVVRVLKVGFMPVETLMTVQPGAVHKAAFNLLPMEEVIPHGSLKIVATPWAEVLVDGRSLGTTKEKTTFGNILSGKHRVKLTCPGYPAYEKDVIIMPNQEVSVSHNFAAKGWLNISCVNENQNSVVGKIWIDGAPHGQTPRVVRDLYVGPHKIEVAAEGYVSDIRTVIIKANEGEKVQFVLKSSP